jgi:hypothetical protein
MAPSQQVVRLARVPVDNFTDCDCAPDELIQAAWNFPVDFAGVLRTIDHAARPLSWPMLQAPLEAASRWMKPDFCGHRSVNSGARII